MVPEKKKKKPKKMNSFEYLDFYQKIQKFIRCDNNTSNESSYTSQLFGTRCRNVVTLQIKPTSPGSQMRAWPQSTFQYGDVKGMQAIFGTLR